MTPGLSQAEAARRLAAEGPNSLPASAERGILPIALEVVREPMFMLLVAATAIYLVLGDLHEALVLAASVLVVMAITIVQEKRTEHALAALRDLSSPRALVVRDGEERRIAGADVVRGDLLILREGDRVPADAALVDAHGLQVDESLLTGESMPVAKKLSQDGFAQVYSGTLVVKGIGKAEVAATGARTELGRIGTSLAALDPGKTSLERETARMVRILAIGGGALCFLAATLFIVMRGDLLAGILAGLTLAMAILPEEFPVVLTVFLALGAWRIGKHGVLTRRMPAIEMLGAATVLCCDKTGTLTENRMAIVEAWARERWIAPPQWGEREAALVANAALACEVHPFDPMERAILTAAEGARQAPGAGGRKLERRYPMAGDFLAVAHAWRESSGSGRVAMKGAPETVLAACRLSAPEVDTALSEAALAASRGLRLLAVARANWAKAAWADSPRDYAFEFLGFVALADPVRESVPAAVELCRRAGIRVVMITGDHPETARAIASQAGISAGDVMTGTQLAALDDAALAAIVNRVQVFARVRPEQKLRLVEAYRAAGEVVAMTGDGVNDAPALRAAHIGIAMGRRGTDVAREAASLVLLDDDFASIVATVRMGRRIYDNIRNAMRYLVAVHVPIAGMSFIPIVAGWPLLLFPVHVVFLEFVIDPACSIAFEAERSDARIMERRPRPPGERLFSARALLIAASLGLSVLVGVAAVYGGMLSWSYSEGAARAAAFAAIVSGNLALIVANRSVELTFLQTLRRGNRAFWWIVAGAVVALGAVIYVPAVASLFRFEPIGLRELAMAIAGGVLPLLWYDVLKVLQRRAG